MAKIVGRSSSGSFLVDTHAPNVWGREEENRQKPPWKIHRVCISKED